MTRDDLSFLCTPFYSIAWALRLDLGTPEFPDRFEGYIAWALTGIIAGLTPVVGPVVAKGLQGALSGSMSTKNTKVEETNVREG